MSAFEKEERKSSRHHSEQEDDAEERHLDTVLEMTLEDTVKNEIRFKEELDDLVNESEDRDSDEGES